MEDDTSTVTDIILKCDKTNGKCECKPEYKATEDKCDRCADSHYRADGICQNCNCHSTGTVIVNDVASCGEFTGQCDCNTGYTGTTCNECLVEDGYIDTSTDNYGPVCSTFSSTFTDEIDASTGADCALTDGTTIVITTQIVGADGTGIQGMKVKYTCPGTTSVVLLSGESDASGYIQFTTSTKTGVAFVAYDPNGVYADMIIQPTIPTTSKREVPSSLLRGHDDQVLELTFSVNCAATRFGTNCAYECADCFTETDGVNLIRNKISMCN